MPALPRALLGHGYVGDEPVCTGDRLADLGLARPAKICIASVRRETMSPIVLYDNRESTNANKVRFLLAELGLDHEIREMPLRDKPDKYFEVHPFGLVPAVIDGDLVITESNVALRYLAEREGRSDLRGTTAAHRARIDGLLDTLSLELRPALWAAEESWCTASSFLPRNARHATKRW